MSNCGGQQTRVDFHGRGAVASVVGELFFDIHLSGVHSEPVGRIGDREPRDIDRLVGDGVYSERKRLEGVGIEWDRAAT